jgi:O-antigen/teichoic acid export membrane protein
MKAAPRDAGATPQTRLRNRFDALVGHVLDPLFRHAYTLVVNTGLTSVLGFAYWVVVGRLYTTADVGRNAAIISSVMFLGSVAQLNLRPVLARFVPVAGGSANRLVVGSYAAAAIAAIVGAIGFVLVSPLWAGDGALAGLRDDAAASLFVIVATATWTIFSLQDGVLIGLRSTVLLLVENVTFSVAKIVVVVALALTTVPPLAIAISWIGPMVVGVIVINAIIFVMLLPRHVAANPYPDPTLNARRVIRFAAGDYVGSLFTLSYTALLPVIVIGQASETAAAQFYIVWVITTSLQVLPNFMVVSLVVDTAQDPSTFRRQGRRVLIGMSRTLLPLCLGVAVFAPLILRVFGEAYVDATLLLRLLSLSIIPFAVNTLYIGQARLRVSARRIITVQAIIAGLVLGLTVLLMPQIGIDGVGVACLVGQGLVAIILLATTLRPLLTRGEADPTGNRGGGQPASDSDRSADATKRKSLT